MKAGEEAIFKLGIGRIDREIVKLIGTLKYRYSYGQNALQHSYGSCLYRWMHGS